jgi:hypothetical protein
LSRTSAVGQFGQTLLVEDRAKGCRLVAIKAPIDKNTELTLTNDKARRTHPRYRCPADGQKTLVRAMSRLITMHGSRALTFVAPTKGV